jgi:membrane-bound serine protease (ClpP class)
VPVLLFVVGFVALFLELFLPAAGVVGAMGLVCMITATVLAYRSVGTAAGTVFLAGILVGTPAMIMLGLKAFPKSFIGKRLILHQSMEQESGYTSSDVETYRGLLGKAGTALTTLRPAGTAGIGNRKYSVVTGGEMIDKNEAVVVVQVEGNRVVVRKKA